MRRLRPAGCAPCVIVPLSSRHATSSNGKPAMKFTAPAQTRLWMHSEIKLRRADDVDLRQGHPDAGTDSVFPSDARVGGSHAAGVRIASLRSGATGGHEGCARFVRSDPPQCRRCRRGSPGRSGPALGVPLIAGRISRAYLDLNRAADELDPLLVEGVVCAGSQRKGRLRASASSRAGPATAFRSMIAAFRCLRLNPAWTGFTRLTTPHWMG